jgi:hypothetical protein
MNERGDGKDLLMVLSSFPRSGTHWLKQMVSYLVGTPALESRVVDRVLLIEALRSHASSRLVYDHFEYSLHSAILDPKRIQNLRMVLLYRHPLDALISMFYRFQATGWLPHPELSAVDNLKKLIRLHDGRECIPEEYRLTQFSLLFPLQRYVQERIVSWVSSDRCLPVRYEDLVENTSMQLIRVAHHYGLDPTNSAIAKAVENASFEKLSGGRPKGTVDESSHYRRGLPEEWREVLGSEELQIVEGELGKELRLLGYQNA